MSCMTVEGYLHVDDKTTLCILDNPKFEGCFLDDILQGDVTATYTTSSQMTVSKCTSFCKLKKYKYAALQVFIHILNTCYEESLFSKPVAHGD